MAEKVGPSSSAKSCKSLVGIGSGPVALWMFRPRSDFLTPLELMLILFMDLWGLGPLDGMLPVSSLVYTEWNCLFDMSAWVGASLYNRPSDFFNGAIPLESCFRFLTYDQIFSSCLSCLQWWCPGYICHVLVWSFFSFLFLVFYNVSSHACCLLTGFLLFLLFLLFCFDPIFSYFFFKSSYYSYFFIKKWKKVHVS